VTYAEGDNDEHMEDPNPTDPALSSLEGQLAELGRLDPAEAPAVANQIADELVEALDDFDES